MIVTDAKLTTETDIISGRMALIKCEEMWDVKGEMWSVRTMRGVKLLKFLHEFCWMRSVRVTAPANVRKCHV